MPARAVLTAVVLIAQLRSASQVEVQSAAGGVPGIVDRRERAGAAACSPTSVVAAAWPREGEFIATSDEFIRFLSPAKIWQRVPVVARRSDTPNTMLVSFHPRRLTSDPCRTPDMVSHKWSLWINESDGHIRPDTAANEVYNGPSSRRQDHYYNSGTGSGGDNGDGPGAHGSSRSPGRLLLPPPSSSAHMESIALLSLQRALRPSDDGIGLSAALWKDQIGSWGQSPGPANACPTDGSRAWEAVRCSDDRQHVVKVKLLGLADAALGTLGGGRYEGTLPAELGALVRLEELWLNIHSISGTIPASFGNLAALRRLHLGFNSLTGGIPAELGQLNALEFLDLQSNHLSGTVPALPALLQQEASHEVPLIRRLRLGRNDGLILPDWLVYTDDTHASRSDNGHGLVNEGEQRAGTAKGRRGRRKSERQKAADGG